MQRDDGDIRRRLTEAIEQDDVGRLDAALHEAPDAARAVLNEPTSWTPPLIARARSRDAARRLLDHGADLGCVSDWWAPGFNVIPNVDRAVGALLVDAGAVVTAHAAAGLGHLGALSAMLDADPGIVHAKGGDGCRPLHFARTIEVAALLLDHGAEVDARDDDHESTAVQWLIGDVPEVAAFLVSRGATPDIFLAAALGDRDLVERCIAADADCLALRVGLEPAFPPIGYKGLGGTIYQWTLGFNAYAHQYALRRGHDDLFRLMMERSNLKTRFLVACLTARREEATRIAAEHPDLVGSLPDADRELLARYCWETNADVEAVRLMLDLGWPVDHPETSHAYMPLHNAAWGGYADLVDLLIARGAPVDARDPEYQSTPLGFAIHCACEEKRHPEGEYERVVGALIDAGCPWDRSIYPTGHAGIDAALRARGA